MKASTIRRVNRWVEKWKPRLLLDGWTVIVEFVEDEEVTNNLVILATMTVNQVYGEGRLVVLPSFERETLHNQEATIVHELLHISTHSMRQALDLATKKGVISGKKQDSLVENITEYIAKTVFKSYCRGKKSREEGFHL